MPNHVEIESIREGAYLLRRLGYMDEARQFILGRGRDLGRCNRTLNGIIENNFFDYSGGKTILRRVTRYQEIYRERLIHESQITWLRNDQNACVYFWLFMFKNYSHLNDDISIDEILPVRRRSHRRRSHQRRDHKVFTMLRSDLPVISAFNPDECLTAALSLMDLSPYYLDERNKILEKIKIGYNRLKLEIKIDFSWFTSAGPEYTEWVWEQLKKNEYILDDFNDVDLGPEAKFRAVPLVYYLWGERKDTKILFLNNLRKRFANMKHRQKVADKKPINIRVSEKTKNNLEKLAKHQHLNSADVIEFLINKAWDNLNRKN